MLINNVGKWSINTLDKDALEKELFKFETELAKLWSDLSSLHGDSFCDAKDRIAWLEQRLPLIKRWLDTLPKNLAT